MAAPRQPKHRPSPNHGPRQGSVDMLLLHYTGMESEEGALAWLCDPRSSVSAHYCVFEDGTVYRLVDEDRRAWHAGRAFWAGETDINSRSVGIEIANPGHAFGYRPFPEPQIDAVIELCRAVLARHAIPAARVLAHADVAPSRKQDPGELFPWRRLHAAGVGLWPAGSDASGDAVSDAELTKRFRRFGYGIEGEDENGASFTEVVTAFQRHFRPERVDGIADAACVARLDDLLRQIAPSA